MLVHHLKAFTGQILVGVHPPDGIVGKMNIGIQLRISQIKPAIILKFFIKKSRSGQYSGMDRLPKHKTAVRFLSGCFVSLGGQINHWVHTRLGSQNLLLSGLTSPDEDPEK